MPRRFPWLQKSGKQPRGKVEGGAKLAKLRSEIKKNYKGVQNSKKGQE